MSVADKLTQLTAIRASMREKLIAKGIDAETHNFADFPQDVEDISSGSSDIITYTNYAEMTVTASYNEEEI